jgi:hypothetical protein
MFYFQARVEQSESSCSSSKFQFLLRCQSAVKPYHHAETTIHESICPAGCPKNTRLTCNPGTSETNSFYSCQGVQVPVQTGTPSSQHCRPGLSVVLRPPPKNLPLTVGPERAKTHDKRATSLPAPISKYVLGTIYL